METREQCENCSRRLDSRSIVWLEFDQRTGTYVDPGKVVVPEDKSQGLYPFGADCAKTILGCGRRA